MLFPQQVKVYEGTIHVMGFLKIKAKFTYHKMFRNEIFSGFQYIHKVVYLASQSNSKISLVWGEVFWVLLGGHT